MKTEAVRFLPKNISYLEARFLSENQQRSYEEATKTFKNKEAQNSLRIPRNGSNLFKVLFLNQMGIRTATLSELDQIAQTDDSDFLRGTFEDSPSVVLRSSGDSFEKNDYLAKSLAKLIRKRIFRNPIVINGLKVTEDKFSPCGLEFKEGKNFEFFEAPELSYPNNNRRFSRQDERGMPIFDENGNRTLYTRQDGLSRLYLDRDLGLDSYGGGLANSGGVGRVVVVSAEGTSPEKTKGEKQ